MATRAPACACRWEWVPPLPSPGSARLVIGRPTCAARARGIQDPERKTEVGELLGEVDDDEYARLVTLGKMMSDYTAAGAAAEGEVVAGDALDDDIGVAVEFENEDEDDEEDEVDEVMVRGACMPARPAVACWHPWGCAVERCIILLHGASLQAAEQGRESACRRYMLVEASCVP